MQINNNRDASGACPAVNANGFVLEPVVVTMTDGRRSACRGDRRVVRSSAISSPRARRSPRNGLGGWANPMIADTHFDRRGRRFIPAGPRGTGPGRGLSTGRRIDPQRPESGRHGGRLVRQALCPDRGEPGFIAVEGFARYSVPGAVGGGRAARGRSRARARGCRWRSRGGRRSQGGRWSGGRRRSVLRRHGPHHGPRADLGARCSAASSRFDGKPAAGRCLAGRLPGRRADHRWAAPTRPWLARKVFPRAKDSGEGQTSRHRDDLDLQAVGRQEGRTGTVKADAQPSRKRVRDRGRVVYRFTGDQVLKMIEIGILDGSDVELWNGVVYRMTKGELHNVIVMATAEALRPVTPQNYHVREEKSSKDGRHSLPEPDVAVARGKRGASFPAPPALDQMALLVEVDHHTARARRPRETKTLRARNVPVYWIIKAKRRCVQVFDTPRGTGKSAAVHPDAGVLGGRGGPDRHRRPRGRAHRRGRSLPRATSPRPVLARRAGSGRPLAPGIGTGKMTVLAESRTMVDVPGRAR